MARGRFAPSPSGDLHLGGARTALAAWLAARRDGGGFVVRIEDVDRPRVVAGAEQRILEDLAWLGLEWDGQIVRQSERVGAYDVALRRLEAEGLVFRCFCSRADVAQAASAPHGPGRAYPGTCRGLSASEATAREAAGERAALRFRAPEREVCFVDGVHGRVCGRADDFVVRRSDGLHAYQLAVVVDDIAQGIEEVVRGDDLLDSTPRQLMLYEALESAAPRFAHVPLVLGPDGRRLAKRHGAIAVRALRAAGWSAEAVVGWLAASLGLLAAPEPVSARALVAEFGFERLRREAVVVDPKGLLRAD